MNEISASTLTNILDAKFGPDASIALRDLFALGCYLHLHGQKEAGKKACRAACRSIGYSPPETDYDKHAEYFSSLLENLEENEARYVREILPHTELAQLPGLE